MPNSGNNVNDIKLSLKTIANLRAMMNGGQVIRSANKPDAVKAFTTALGKHLGDTKALSARWKVLLAPDTETASFILGQMLEEAAAREGRHARPNMTPPKNKGSKNVTTETKSTRGRKSGFLGKRIKPLVEANVRRPNSHGFKSLQLVLEEPGLPVEEFVQKGGRLKDLRWDVDHGNVAVTANA